MASDDAFVPAGFAVPDGLTAPSFRLVPLGPEHNLADHAAWSGSIAHIRATPGFQGGSWPPVEGMTLEANRDDLERHARDFAARNGFTYSVLAPDTGDVIGCVYIYPVPEGDHDACALSWVRESRAHLDAPLWRAVSEWLASDWPFDSVEYAPRA